MSVILECGDALTILRTLPDECMQCCITSPPYWGLRDYEHDGQIGLESTPKEYVGKLVEVFREVRRVLHADGTLWLNLGDSYAGYHGNKNHTVPTSATNGWVNGTNENLRGDRKPQDIGLKQKDLVGIPWQTAFALQADGWYLRSEIIWHKPNPLPESVKDRPTKAHEQIFLFSKSPNYYYNAAAILEPFADSRAGNPGGGGQYSVGSKRNDSGALKSGVWNEDGSKKGRNKRSVWTIASQPFKGAHFAVFPPALVEPCLLAGSRENDFILDPFTGSGTVGVVCKKHNRLFLGIDLNPEYLKLAQERIYA